MRFRCRLPLRRIVPLAAVLVALSACAPSDGGSSASLAEQDRARATQQALSSEAESSEPVPETTQASRTEPAEPLPDLSSLETTDDRPDVLSYLGQPDAFTISIAWVDGAPVKMESWRYFQYGTRVDFVDGAAVWTIEIEPMPDGTIFAAWYDPLAFEVGMSEAEAAAAIAAASPAGQAPTRLPLDEGGEDLAGGVVLVGDQILIGLADDQIVYVETVALAAEEGDR